VARRITTAAAGFGAVASLLLPGLTSIVPSANAAPLRAAPGSTIGAEHQVTDALAGTSQDQPAVASGGQNSFVVWNDDRFAGGTREEGYYPWGGRIYGSRLGPNGERLDGTGIAISAGPEVPDTTILQHVDPAVAFDGTNYLVVWKDDTDGANAIRAARVSAAGQVLDRFEIDSSEHRPMDDPDVAFGGGVFMVVWDAHWAGVPDGDIHATRVSTTGAILDPQPIQVDDPTGNASLRPAIASDGTDFQVVWEESRFVLGLYDVYGTRVSAGGEVHRPNTAITVRTARDQDHNDLDVAWQNGTYLATWTQWYDEARSDSDVYGARLDDTGAVLDPGPFAIAAGPDHQSGPRVAGNGGRFFVAWRDGRYDADPGTSARVGTEIGTDGTIESPDGQLIGFASEGLAVAPASDSRFGVAYSRYNGSLDATQAFLRHVSPK
jgi:hypothetical protein